MDRLLILSNFSHQLYFVAHIFLISFLSMANNLFVQNVGIGIISPTEKLHVVGNIKGDIVKLTIDANTKRFLIGAKGYIDFSGKAVFIKYIKTIL